MERVKLAIVDADLAFATKIESVLQNHGRIEVSGTCADGITGLELIRQKQPDVVLFDLVLPGIDGISFLKEILSFKNPPMCICCTQFYSSIGLEACRNNGASYFLYKPIEIHALQETILSCFVAYKKIQLVRNSTPENNIANQLEIKNYLVSLGIPSKLIGCSYLAEAIRLAIKDTTLTQNLSKGLYLEIGREMDATPVCIERCIRSAISAAYKNGRLGSRMTSCPSNKEFINYVLRTYRD